MPPILIVDDEAGMRELVTRMLSGREYLTLEARTAEAALDLLELTPDIQVVIADLHMPGRGGGWLVDQIRSRYPSIAVILATADGAVPGTVSLQPSVVSYLVKPIASAKLIAAVEQACAWHDQQPAPDRASASDPIEPWLNRKLTRHRDDDPEPHE